MKNAFFLASLLLVFALTGCATGTATATPIPTGPTIVLPALTEPPSTSTGAMMPGCTVVSNPFVLGESGESRFEPVGDRDWVLGVAEAAVTIVVYSDFQCPACGRLAPVLVQLEADFSADLRVVFRHFPLLSVHDKAALAAQAAETAGAQGKFWEMHNVLFQQQGVWATLTPSQFETWLESAAKDLGLDVAQFQAALVSEANAALAQKAWDAGLEKQIPQTPFLLINGEIYDGPTDYGNLSLIIRLLALQKRQYPQCPPLVIDTSKQYVATLETEKGDIVIQLFAEESPIAVNNFVFLAREGWFAGVTFHRVLPNFMAQTGDPSGTGFGGPGYAFVNESSSTLHFDKAGVVAMANAGPDSNGSQLFITLGPTPHLEGGYTIFGQVIEGMEVVGSISLRDPAQGHNLPPGDKILRVTIDER